MGAALEDRGREGPTPLPGRPRRKVVTADPCVA